MAAAIKILKMNHCYLFADLKEEWNLDQVAIQRASDLYSADYSAYQEGSEPSKLLLFLYAKGILAQKSSVVRKNEFESLLHHQTSELEKALERLKAIVEKGETSPIRQELEPQSFFEEFVLKHPEWASKDSFVVFRDHPDLQGKSHALVERFQKSGLCYMHACVVVQHYLVAMNNQEEVPMLNMAEYLKKYMKSDELYEHIWNNKGGDSLNFLESILKKRPASDGIFNCSNRNDLDSMENLLKSDGPALVSGFYVTQDFTGNDWQHLGNHQGTNVLGKHAMALVGYRVVDGKTHYLLQNWWKSKPYVEVDSDYLLSSRAIIHFIKDKQTEMGKYPVSFETLVECEYGMDASENFIPEGNNLY